MASRILGMGDVLSLIDKVQANIDEQEALDMAKKMRANDFTLEDFLAQMQQIKKMGPLKDLLGMMPGIPGMGKLDLESALNGVDPPEGNGKNRSHYPIHDEGGKSKSFHSEWTSKETYRRRLRQKHCRCQSPHQAV